MRICVEISKECYCPSRHGEVLTKEEIENPETVEDRRFCSHRKGEVCTVVK
jgi:hypothetical protein